MRRTLAALIAVLLIPPAVTHTQGIPVIDISNFQQLLEMATKTLDTLNTVRKQYETVSTIAKGIEDLSGYKIPAVPTFNHDVGRFDFGQPWLEGLNSGDPRGERYYQVVHKLKPPPGILLNLPPEARETIQRAYAGIEILDSIAMMGGHQDAIVRGYHGKLAGVIQLLENDVLSKVPGFHQLTAIMDKISAAQLINRRSDMAANQLSSNVLEQMIGQNMLGRAAEAQNLNMRLNQIDRGPDMGRAMMQGADDALARNWQP
jgi:hypothetical protein